MAFKIDRLDHLVLTVQDIDATCEFYTRAMGMEVVTFAGDRKALTFGCQKINLHQVGNELDPHASHPQSGSGDICLITTTPIDDVIQHLNNQGVGIVEGPVMRTGAVGDIRSVYIMDPDHNLIEISNYM